MTEVATSNREKSRFLEGGNGLALITIPAGVIICAIFYSKIGPIIANFNIKIEDVYSYVFNLFAIEFAALLALFSLLACKPTPFLERIKNTHAFASILHTTRITMYVATFALAVTFVFGIIRLEPEGALTWPSILFLGWAGVAAATTAFFVRTVRLIFTALA
jgi:hypothetical protein